VAIQQINIGGFENDPSADFIRAGGQIINNNFIQLRQIVVDNKSANKIFAGPASGSSSAPSFRSLTTNDLPDNGVTLDKLSTDIQLLLNQLVPIGTIFEYAGSVTPAGFLICDGSEISRTTYASLFNVIGTAFGAGNGFTTFNLPDKRGRVGVGVDASVSRITANSTNGANVGTLGGAGGADTHTLTESQMPSHTHNSTTGHPFIGGPVGGGALFYSSGSFNLSDVGVAAKGGGQAHSNTQPWIALNYIIKI
jgi:microcystin-dependent protein